MKFSYLKISLTLGLIFIFAGFLFAQTEREKGIKLFKQGKNKEAVAVLERASEHKETETDADVWHYLGLAYINENDLKKAVKALEKAVNFNAQNSLYRTNLAYAYFLSYKLSRARDESTKAIGLDLRNAEAYYTRGSVSNLETKYDEAISDAEKAININPNYSPAYILKADALFSSLVKKGSKLPDALNLLEQSRNVLETCLKNCRNNANRQIQLERLDAVNAFYDYYSKRKDADLSAPLAALSDPNITPLKILSKKAAVYDAKAREGGITGTVSLLVLFSASGKVKHIVVVNDLGFGLTENAIEAAREIKFEPAKKYGKPISQVEMMRYSFSISTTRR